MPFSDNGSRVKIDIRYEVKKADSEYAMGVVWSKSRLTSNNTRIVVDCEFPRNRVMTQKIWAAFAANKDAIKADGFSTKKDDRTGLWGIAYWHVINDESHIKDNTTGKPQWRVDMERKLTHWIKVIEETIVDADDFSRPRKTVVNLEKPAAATTPKKTVETVYEESVLDFELDLDDEGEVVSKPTPPSKAAVKPAAAEVPIKKPVNKPVRVDINKLLEAPDEEF